MPLGFLLQPGLVSEGDIQTKHVIISGNNVKQPACLGYTKAILYRAHETQPGQRHTYAQVATKMRWNTLRALLCRMQRLPTHLHKHRLQFLFSTRPQRSSERGGNRRCGLWSLH